MNNEELIEHSLKNVFDMNLPEEVYTKATKEYIKIRMEDSGYEFPDDYMVLYAHNRKDFIRNVAAAELHWVDKQKGKAKDFDHYLQKVSDKQMSYTFDSNYNNFIRMRAEFCFAYSIKNDLDEHKRKVAERMIDVIHETNFSYTDIREQYGFVLTIPKMSVNENYELDSLDGPAIQFKEGGKYYYLKGREVDADIFEEEITKEKFLAETNADRIAAMAAVVEHRHGENALFALFKAKQVSDGVLSHGEDTERISVWKATTKIGGEKSELFWVEQVCPSTGAIYYASIDKPSDVIDAMKKTRDPLIPSDLPYEWEGFRT
jgi:hypothetical protein